MKITIILTIFLFLLLYCGCNSSIYEIVEVEETVEIKEELKPPVADIKEEAPVPEKKITGPEVVSKNYVVQIGAFTDEVNAGRFTNKAKQNLAGEEIYYKDIDGLFKVRLGNFSSKTDAINMMQKLKESGYTDSFVVELTYIKVENK